MRLEGENRGKVLCEKCRHPFPLFSNGVLFETACEACGALYEGALFRVAEQFLPQTQAVREIQQAEDAQCFFHPGKQAVQVCSACGRMVCALCDIEQSSGHICPSCINDRRRVDADGRVRRSWAYINAAWSLTLLGVVIPVLPGFLTLFFVIAGLRNTDYSYSIGRKVSLCCAGVLTLLFMAGYSLIFILAFLNQL
jgi:hypothetical protein